MNLVLQFLKNLRPFIRKGSTTFDEVVATFKNKFKRDPEGVEVISIRKEFKDAAEGEKVIPFPSGGKDKVKYYTEPGKDFSPNMKRKSPYSGKTYHEMLEEKYGFELRGTESMGQIKQMIKNINVNKELDEIIKTKKPKDLKDNIEDPDFASGGRVGYLTGGGVESVTNSALDDEEAANLNPARAFQMARSFFGNPVVQGGIAFGTGGLSGLLGYGKKAVAAELVGQVASKAIQEKMFENSISDRGLGGSYTGTPAQQAALMSEMSQDNSGGGDHDGGASASAQSDDAAGMGGYKIGGRIGFSEGGGYWEIVGDAHTKAGGEEGTGLSLFDFADMYFPKPLAEGSLTTMFKRK